jgi:hypothetical protein
MAGSGCLVKPVGTPRVRSRTDKLAPGVVRVGADAMSWIVAAGRVLDESSRKVATSVDIDAVCFELITLARLLSMRFGEGVRSRMSEVVLGDQLDWCTSVCGAS